MDMFSVYRLHIKLIDNDDLCSMSLILLLSTAGKNSVDLRWFVVVTLFN